ncbi:efflux RND transporter periplasmic adaptor subunit [Congregibacter litoralis]|uniref:RND family efflux transporter, MFP subunit n=1 Tax=Congregibacter litoralis KT71 TaxID=314285 RepID=A4ABP0_9GAMM|nr:efflux RND transporter periplasmic adaptor subunit [Congregibacter litoralis]EAQ96553.2 RND family efflux transporter, MFP subunit [Congregibacter litoralis KT71]
MDRPIQGQTLPRWLVPALVVAALVAAGVWFATRDYSTSFTLDGQRIRTDTVTTGTYEDYIPLRAIVEPGRSVFLDAIEGGRVERLLVEEGATVAAGQPLVELSNTTLQLDVIAREAEVSEQLNNLRNTELAIEQNRLSLKGDLVEIDYQMTRLGRLVKRYTELEGKEFISRNEYENALDELEYWSKRREITLASQAQDERIRVAQMQQLQASVSQLEQNLTLARANLENLLIVAPRSGLLSSFDAEIGESKARGERLGQIDDVDHFKASALVNEFYLNRVSVGQRARLELDGKAYTLELSKIYPEVSGAQFEVDLRFLDDTPGNIRRGQTLQLRLMLGDTEEQATLVSNGAFLIDTGGAWVFVLSPDRSVATRRDVQLGRRNPNQIEVVSGLLPGDVVITSSYSSFINVDRLFIDR